MSWRKANIAAGIAAVLWLAIFAMGRDLTYHVYEQGPGIFPNSGQFDAYVVIPFGIAFGLSLAGWVANGLKRGQMALAAFAIVSIMAILPFMLGYSGGV